MCGYSVCGVVTMDISLLLRIAVISLLARTAYGRIECSVGCPLDHFEAKPCTNFGDRICETCRVCDGSTYEVQPCSATSDRVCIHAAHPLLMDEDQTMPTFLEGLKMEHSANVFLEDLHNTRDLETTFYVTDRTQASDFKWQRESGLTVKIGILNVHLIPQYEDVWHEGDNKYMLKNPNDSEDKLKFKHIVDNQCRNPIPDYYSITLEISRDRMTTAKMETCDGRNPALPDCPVGQVDGDTYLARTLNEPCTKMGTFPEVLNPAANSIVCTENTGLLREVFNRSYTEERPIKFLSDKCKRAQSRCEQCVKQFGCNIQELFESRCCRVDCYTLPFCKQARSPECTESPVACAMGDAYRYTIQPVFQKIKEEFRCHVKHKPSDQLYQLFYYMEMPETGFVTPKEYKTVYAKDLMYESHGDFQTDYLSIEHNTGIDLREEFMLVGTDLPETDLPHKDTVNFTLHPLKNQSDYHSKRSSVVHRIDHNIYVATTEFTRPFDYSTSSWVKNNECHKDVSKFNYYDKDAGYKQPTQNVKVTTQSVPDAPFKYWLQSADTPPFIRCTVPGNMSILPWYFKNKNVELLTNDDYFKAELVLTPGDKVWNIHIQGRMSDCPGYLGIRINDREEMEELIRADLLIMCPTTFNVTFHIPNFGLFLDKTFDIHFDDTKKTYHTFLTQLNVGLNEEVRDPEPVILMEASEVSYTVFVVIAGVTLITVAILNKCYLYSEVMRAKRKVFHTAKTNEQDFNMSIDSGPLAGDMYNSQLSDDPLCGNQLNTGQLTFLVIYVLLRIIYSLLFTFTVFFAILMIFIRSDLARLSEVDNFVQGAKNESVYVSHDIDKHWRVELLRQAEKVTDMQGACSNYVKELFDSMAFQMNNITNNYYNTELYGAKTSLSYLMHQRSKVLIDALRQDIENYTEHHRELLSQRIAPSINKYEHFIEIVFQNDWPSFAQKLFNSSDYQRNNRSPMDKAEDLLLMGIKTDFMRFMEMEEVEFVRLWALRYWQKYELLLPELPGLPVPQVEPHHLYCLPSGNGYNITRQPSLTHMHSVRFFSPNLPADVVRGPVYYQGNTRHEYKFVTPTPPLPVLKNNLPSASEELEVKNMVDTEILSMIFLILDAMLLLYRFSHTYLNASVIVKGFSEEISKEEIEEQEYYTRPPMAPTSVTTGTTTTTVTSKYKHASDYSHIPLGQGIVDSNTFQYEYHGNGGPGGFHGNNLGNKSRDSGSHGINGGGTGATSTLSSTGGGIYYRSGGGRTDFCKILTDTCAKVILSNSLPRVLIGGCVLVLVYTLMKVVCVVAEMNFILDSNLLSATYTSGMDVQINQTNWYLADQAHYFNEVSMNIYQGQMRSELKYLQSMLQYFDVEQKRLVDNHLAEGCNITHSLAANWTCDIPVQPPTLNIPLLPCNFVPINPSLFSDVAPIELEQSLVKSLEPYILSSRHVTMVITYIIFIAMAAMLIIHVCGVVIFHFVKSSNKFTVRRVYVTSYLPGSAGRLGSCLGGADDLPPPPTEESDYESDDNDGSGGVWSHTMPSKHRGAGGGTEGGGDTDRYMRTYPSPSKRHHKGGGPNQQEQSGTLLNDFKYSETKV